MSSPFAQLAEARIKDAIDTGAFENLTGSGEPIDLDAYLALRAGFGFLKSAQVLPPEVSALREIEDLRNRAAQATGEKAVLLRKELQMREVELAMAMERVKRAMKADLVG
jgi:hypothetical protein